MRFSKRSCARHDKQFPIAVKVAEGANERIALDIGLQERPPSTILDLGCGPCHFGYVARYFGHQTVGTDIPIAKAVEGTGERLYDRLSRFFGIERKLFFIEAFKPLPAFEQRFDLVVGLMIQFNALERGGRWDEAAWMSFFRDLASNVLTPDGQLYLKLNVFEGIDETFRVMERCGGKIDPTLASVFFADMKRFR